MSAPSWFDWRASTLMPERGRVLGDGGDDLGQRRRAVDLRLAQAEPAEVRAVEEQDPHRRSLRRPAPMRSSAA